MSKSKRSPPLAGETIILDETHLGPFQIRVTTGSSTLIVDEPMGSGGLGSGPNPYDLVSAALAACSLLTMRLFATRRRWPLVDIRMRMTHHRDGLKARDSFLKEVLLIGKLTESQRLKIMDVGNHSPLHLSFEQEFQVKTVLLPDGVLDWTATTRQEHVRDMTEACE